MSLAERIHHLNREIGDTVERAVAELRQEISQRLRAGNEELQRRLDELSPMLPAVFLSPDELAGVARELGHDARHGALRDLRAGLAAVDRARSQAEILGALLREAARYASRAAVLLVRGSEMRGWGAQGFGDAEAAIRNLGLEVQDSSWVRLIQGEGAVRLSAGDCASLCSRIESPLPREGVLVPLVLRDRVAAALYADRLEGGDLDVDALQILAYGAAQAIETLPFRERASTPTLTLAAGEAAPAPASPVPASPVPAAPPEPPEPELEAEPAVEAAAETVEPVAEPAAAAGAPWTEDDERFAVAAEEAPAPAAAPEAPAPAAAPEPPVPRFTAELPVSAAAETAAIPAGLESPQAEEAPRYPRSVEPEPTAPVRAPGPGGEATVLLERPSLQPDEPAPAPPPMRPVPAPEPAAAGVGAPERPSPLVSGTPEVAPPSGVDGPGWAFATTRVPVASFGNEAQHEEARRLARLLVSEIKLYNEEQVDEGRRSRDIYERLKEDIDRSRQMYDERVDPQILRSTDYFYQELVRILAAGDSKALGI